MMNSSSWNEQEQMDFYKNLKTLPTLQQGPALIKRAEEMLESANPDNDSLLKAIESMLNLWTLRFSDPVHEERVNKSFNLLYKKMGLNEKAKAFK